MSDYLLHGGDLPRYPGIHAFALGDTSSERAMHSSVQWLQRKAGQLALIEASGPIP